MIIQCPLQEVQDVNQYPGEEYQEYHRRLPCFTFLIYKWVEVKIAITVYFNLLPLLIKLILYLLHYIVR